MAKKNTNTQAQAMFTEAQVQEIVAQAVAKALAGMQAPTPAGKGKPAVELVEFKKANGETKMVTPAQAEAWGKYRDGASGRKEQFEKMKQEWDSKREGYKPSKALKDAIKTNRAAITHKIAKEQYGFVGTKKDLQALKESICK